jgi:hypothetical protein
LGSRDVPGALRSVGLSVEIHKDHFNSTCPDHEWLAEVGRRGWIVLTKDKGFRTRQVEVAALMRSGTGTFVLTTANTTGAQNAKAIVAAIPSIKRFLRRFSKPFLAQITAASAVSLVLTHDKMIALHGDLPR